MGFIGKAIGGVTSILGGGSGSKGYSSGNTGQYEDAAKQGAFNMVGATKKADGTYDFSNVGKPITGAAGVQSANQGFDYSGINKALQGYNKGPQAMTQNYQSGYNAQAYKPTQFNYQELPQQYYDQAYQSGSKDINRQGAGQLQQLQSAVGTRRPGLLLKAGQQNQRDVGENLANLSSTLGQQRMQQGVDLGVQQQQNQEAANQYGANLGEQQSQFGANEGYKGYQSRADLEKGNAQNAQNYLQGSLGAGQAKLAGQQSAVSNAQQDQMNRMNYLMQLYTQAQGGNQQSAGLQNQTRGQNLNFISSLVPKI